MTAEDSDRVEHILLRAARAAEIVAEGREAFDTGWRNLDLAIRQLEVIGEAAGKLSDEFVASRPALRVAKAKAMRNFLIHDYPNVHPDRVWYTMTVELPKFIEALQVPDLAAAPEQPDLSGVDL